MRTLKVLAALLLGGVAALAVAAQADACGGFFCQTDPVDQVAERIVFTVNDDDTVSSLIEISYVGEAADFSWILPIPEPIAAGDVAVPDDGDIVFDELHRLTDVTFLDPDPSECVNDAIDNRAFTTAATDDAESAEESVEVFASGEVGPFGFDVIGADDPMALTTWLRDNNYQVDSSMEPLINVYVDEEFSFLAMRLLDGETAESIMPVEITYPGSTPMIPLRLTAVAAFPEMPIYVWIFGDEQAVPENYVHFEVATEELTYSPFGFNDYVSLLQQRADAVGGRGFITEFAGPSSSLPFGDPYLVEQAAEQPYLTRLFTYIDPEEMLVDPMFGFDADAAEISNVRNARDLRGLYDCERQAARRGSFSGSDALDAEVINAQLRQGTFAGYDNLDDSVRLNRGEGNGDNDRTETAAGPLGGDDGGLSTATIVLIAVAGTLAAVALVGGVFTLGRRSGAGDPT